MRRDSLTRRETLKATAGVAALTVLPAGCVHGGWAGSPKVEPRGGLLTVTVTEYPVLGEPGGVQGFLVDGFKHPLVVLRGEDGTIGAVSTECKHRGCTVSWEDEDGRFECHCHGSQYTRVGAVERGPTTRPLTRYPVAFDGETVIVKLTPEAQPADDAAPEAGQPGEE